VLGELNIALLFEADLTNGEYRDIYYGQF